MKDIQNGVMFLRSFFQTLKSIFPILIFYLNGNFYSNYICCGNIIGIIYSLVYFPIQNVIINFLSLLKQLKTCFCTRIVHANCKYYTNELGIMNYLKFRKLCAFVMAFRLICTKSPLTPPFLNSPVLISVCFRYSAKVPSLKITLNSSE